MNLVSVIIRNVEGGFAQSDHVIRRSNERVADSLDVFEFVVVLRRLEDLNDRVRSQGLSKRAIFRRTMGIDEDCSFPVCSRNDIDRMNVDSSRFSGETSELNLLVRVVLEVENCDIIGRNLRERSGIEVKCRRYPGFSSCR